MTHAKSHGGFAAQAKRRGEQYALCGTCGQRSHHFQAEPEERPTPLLIAGLTIFAFALIFGVPFALLILGQAVGV